MTRTTVARLLGVSRACIQYYERTGRLHPVRDADGVYRFDRAEVEALAHTRRSSRLQTLPGDVCADAFSRFQAGESPADVVIALAQPPEYVRALWEEYKALECQRPSRKKTAAPRARESVPSPATLSLVPSTGSAAPSNVSPWSRQFDAQQENKRARRMGYRS